MTAMSGHWEIRDDSGECFGIYSDEDKAKESLKNFVAADPERAADLLLVRFKDGQSFDGVYALNSQGDLFSL